MCKDYLTYASYSGLNLIPKAMIVLSILGEIRNLFFAFFHYFFHLRKAGVGFNSSIDFLMKDLDLHRFRPLLYL